MDKNLKIHTIALDGEYEILVAWLNIDNKNLSAEKFYDTASDTGNVCTLAKFVSEEYKNGYNYIYKTFAVRTTIRQDGADVVEIPNGYRLNLYTGIITNHEDKRKSVIIPRDNLSELLNFLADKGYLMLKETGKDLDDLADEFESLAEY